MNFFADIFKVSDAKGRRAILQNHSVIASVSMLSKSIFFLLENIEMDFEMDSRWIIRDGFHQRGVDLPSVKSSALFVLTT